MKTRPILFLCLMTSACVTTPPSSSVKFHSLGAGKAMEDCFLLRKGQTFVYSFESNQDVDFNIYYKFNHEFVFPVEASNTRSIRGRFKAPKRSNYCLMWSNDQLYDAELTWTLSSDV